MLPNPPEIKFETTHNFAGWGEYSSMLCSLYYNYYIVVTLTESRRGNVCFLESFNFNWISWTINFLNHNQNWPKKSIKIFWPKIHKSKNLDISANFFLNNKKVLIHFWFQIWNKIALGGNVRMKNMFNYFISTNSIFQIQQNLLKLNNS